MTRNRDDFIQRTIELFQTGEPHAGVLIVPRSLPNREPARIARAIARWAEARRPRAAPEQYLLDFLSDRRS